MPAIVPISETVIVQMRLVAKNDSINEIIIYFWLFNEPISQLALFALYFLLSDHIQSLHCVIR